MDMTGNGIYKDNKWYRSLLVVVLTVLLSGCHTAGQRKAAQNDKILSVLPAFSADSAYAYVARQLSFGSRVPNTPAHKACGDWLAQKFRAFGANLIEQKDTVEAFDGTPLHMRNLIAQYQPEKRNRILLMAHWDTRPFADHDPDPANHLTPIPGASDGASGVGILLEIARHLKTHPTSLGIDLILFDVEDYGVPDQSEYEWKADSWCLGSQYWSHHLHRSDYSARFGILLDMVGAAHARFTREEVSLYYAPTIVDKIWNTARELGYGDDFSWQKTAQLVDDHRYVNEITGIPSIDIIQYDPATESNFGSYWHTLNDNLQIISKETLQVVGATVMTVIYREKI